MFLYIKTNILRGYGIFKNDFAHPREPAIVHGQAAHGSGEDNLLIRLESVKAISIVFLKVSM